MQIKSYIDMDRHNQRFYRLLVLLHNTDAKEDIWLNTYRRINAMRKIHGRHLKYGFRLFYKQYRTNGALPLEFADKYFK